MAKPQNVNVLRDIACASYVAGGNCKWFGKEKGADNKYNFTSRATKKSMQDRLSLSDDIGGKYASMLAFPMTAAQYEGGDMDTVMSITSRLLPWEVQAYSGNKHDSFPGGDALYEAYSKLLNLRSVHFGEDMRAAENQEFISQVRSSRGLIAALPCPSHAAALGVRREAQIMHCASWARTGSSIPGRSPSSRSLPVRVTLGPTLCPEMRGGVVESRSRCARRAIR